MEEEEMEKEERWRRRWRRRVLKHKCLADELVVMRIGRVVSLCVGEV